MDWPALGQPAWHPVFDSTGIQASGVEPATLIYLMDCASVCPGTRCCHTRGWYPWRRWIGVAAFSLIAACAWAIWPRNVDLHRFDPLLSARIETQLWQSYYDKDRLGLVIGIYRFGREVYGFSPASAGRMAWHAGRAAVAFQPSKNRAEAQRAIPSLVAYFEVIQRSASLRFDAVTAARVELDWWQLRREGHHWREYAPVVADVTSRIYDVEAKAVLPFALVRCEMMAKRDANRRQGLTSTDWSEIESGLANAWINLHGALHQGGPINERSSSDESSAPGPAFSLESTRGTVD